MSSIREREIILDASLALEQCSPVLKEAMVYTLNQNVEQIFSMLTQPFQDYSNEIASFEMKLKEDGKSQLRPYLQFVSPANFITNIDSIFDIKKLQQIEKIYRQSFYRLTANYSHETSERFLVDSQHFQHLVNEINDLKTPIAEKIAPYINAYQSYIKELNQSKDTAITSLIGGFTAAAVAGPLAGMVARHFIRSNNSKDEKLEQFLQTQNELRSVTFSQIMKISRKLILLLGNIYAGLATKLEEDSQVLKFSYQKFDKEQQLLMVDVSNATELDIRNATDDVIRKIQTYISQNEYEKAEVLSGKFARYFSRNKQMASKVSKGISYGMASQLIHFTVLAQQILAITDDKQKHFYYTKLFNSLTHAPQHMPVVYGIKIVKLEDVVEQYMNLSVKLKEPKFVAIAVQVLKKFFGRFQHNHLVYRENTEYLPATVTKYVEEDAPIQYKAIKIQYPEEIMSLYEAYEYAILYEKISRGEIDDNPSSMNENYMEQIGYYDLHITEVNLSSGTEDDYYRTAMYHLEGKHTKQNTELAVERLKIAAKKGHGQAIFQLISLIEEDTFNVTEKELVAYHKQLYHSDFPYNGHLPYRIGKFYQEGYGIEQNFTEAHRWFEKAVEMNDIPSLFEIGLLYETGKIGKKNKKEAFVWFKKAAALDEERAKDKIERESRKKRIYGVCTLVSLLIVFLIWSPFNKSNRNDYTDIAVKDTTEEEGVIEATTEYVRADNACWYMMNGPAATDGIGLFPEDESVSLPSNQVIAEGIDKGVPSSWYDYYYLTKDFYCMYQNIYSSIEGTTSMNLTEEDVNLFINAIADYNNRLTSIKSDAPELSAAVEEMVITNHEMNDYLSNISDLQNLNRSEFLSLSTHLEQAFTSFVNIVEEHGFADYFHFESYQVNYGYVETSSEISNSADKDASTVISDDQYVLSGASNNPNTIGYLYVNSESHFFEYTISPNNEDVLPAKTKWEVVEERDEEVLLANGYVVSIAGDQDVKFERTKWEYLQENFYGAAKINVFFANIPVYKDKKIETEFYLRDGGVYEASEIHTDGWIRLDEDDWVHYDENHMGIEYNQE